MEKIKASVLVIGYENEDKRMYPCVSDMLNNLRSIYDDIQYIGDDKSLLLSQIDMIKKRISKLNVRDLFYQCYVLLITCFTYFKYYRRLVYKLKNVRMKYDKGFILAINNTAAYFAGKYFPHRIIVFWSLDIFSTEDSVWRIREGSFEKLITDEHALKAKVLMIQDDNRKRILEESLRVSFHNTIYLPVSLNDSEFCRRGAESRLNKYQIPSVNVIQSGWIAENRWSDKLIDAYQNWPCEFKLHLHGFMGDRIEDKIKKAQRKPDLSLEIYDNESLVRFLNRFDIGFIGYGETDSNHKYIENASSQLVMFLRLGIPVIVCGPDLFNRSIEKNDIGIAISSIEDAREAIKKIIDSYNHYSGNARRLYELRFNLSTIFNDSVIKAFEKLCLQVYDN